MKKNRKDINWFIVAWVIFGILFVSFMAFEIYLLVTYGGKPLNEIPTWVVWFLFWRDK
jgi:hypothetical protein